MKTWQPWTITDGTLQLTEWPDHGPGVVVVEGDESMNWRPIETAPKDGSHILLYRPHIQFVGFYAPAGWIVNAPGLPLMGKPLPDGPTESGVTDG